MIEKINLQNFIFKLDLTRMDLLKYSSVSQNYKKVQVFRNHSFELISKTIPAFLDYADLNVEFIYSDYDDSFSFQNVDLNSDAILIWIDATRYNEVDIEKFLSARIKDLKDIYNKPILLAVLGKTIDLKISDVLVFDFADIQKKLGNNFFDLRMETFTGTKLSNQACIDCSKIFGLKYFPALLKPTMKAIIVDLDNTLYSGVLGENGIDGLILNNHHIELQKKLKCLTKEGFFLCAVSKNELSDVENLLKARKDFPLSFEDFTQIKASWNSKSEMIKELVSFLNIGMDSVLFIDDNIGEITEIASNLPQIKYVLADPTGEKTLEILELYPGFVKTSFSKEDVLRNKDTKANQERQNLINSLSHQEFLKQIDMHLIIKIDDFKGRERIAQLANKTNQFIFNYRRYTLSDIEEVISNKNKVVISLHLKDKLSDSGMIGALILVKQDDYAVLDECFISCRALGRGIDDIIIFEAIKTGLNKLKLSKLKVLFQKGERNEPAEKFYNQFLFKYADVSTFEALKQTDLITFDYGE